MSGNKLVWVKDEHGEWEGIYINGELYYEHHSIPTDVMIDVVMLGKYFTELESFWIENEYLEGEGKLPLYFDDIPKERLSK